MYQNLNSKTSPSSETSHEISLVIGPTEVADVMTGKVVTLSPHHSFNDAANLMNDRYFRHCVVVDNQSKVVGVISDRDIKRAERLVRRHSTRLKREWAKLHGKD